MKQFKVHFKINKMLQHNSRLANPLDKYAKQLKVLSGKRNKTDADLQEMALVGLHVLYQKAVTGNPLLGLLIYYYSALFQVRVLL